MPCRAKISVLVTLIGVLTASAAPLNPEQKNSTFQPSISSKVSKTKVIKPSEAKVYGKDSTWNGVKVQKITPSTQPAGKVEVNGFTIQKAKDAPAEPAPVKIVGGKR